MLDDIFNFSFSPDRLNSLPVSESYHEIERQQVKEKYTRPWATKGIEAARNLDRSIGTGMEK